ncbi:putative ACR, YggU family [uncultured archaeon]|nr:putative ACR, YggU family [uncultured archaeon]
MKLSVKLHPNSSQEKIVKIDEKNYEVWIKEKPIEGKANEFLEKFLKKYFKKEVKITSGFTSRKKIIEI